MDNHRNIRGHAFGYNMRQHIQRRHVEKSQKINQKSITLRRDNSSADSSPSCTGYEGRGMRCLNIGRIGVVLSVGNVL